MKIIQVVSQMEAGGAQRVASTLDEGLRARNHDSQVWFLYKKRPAYEENEHARCLRLKRPHGLGWLPVATGFWQSLRREKPDVVLAHTHSANVFAAPIAALAGVPVRIGVHHNPVETYARSWRAADRLVFGLGCYSMMVSVSGGVSESFAHHGAAYRSRLHRIYNGIDGTKNSPAFDVRKRYGIPDKHALLVNIGRLAKQKNQAVLFTMLKEIPLASLLLVGDGERAQELRAAAGAAGIAERVRFTGELPTGDVAAILSQADLFLLPSLYESFCLAAVEAMHQSVPVVASNTRCLREVLGDEQVFFNANDVTELTGLVRTLLHTPEKRAAMGKAGRLRAERFSVERMVGEYECLMAEALLYTASRKSAANNFGGLDTFRRVPRIHDQL